MGESFSSSLSSILLWRVEGRSIELLLSLELSMDDDEGRTTLYAAFVGVVCVSFELGVVNGCSCVGAGPRARAGEMPCGRSAENGV